MKTLYLDCAMGAAGDMLTAALLELMPDRAGAIAELNAIGIPNVVYGCESVLRCGIRGTHMSVKINGVEESETMHDHTLYRGLRLSKKFFSLNINPITPHPIQGA